MERLNYDVLKKSGYDGYVLKEIGQPLHAFDCSYLEGNEI